MSEIKNHFLELFGKRLLIIRNEMNLNKTEMSNKLGIDLVVYRRLESGKGCSSNNLLLIINELAKYNYNSNWLIKENNSNDKRKDEELFFLSFDREIVLKNLNQMNKLITKTEKLIEDV